MALESAFSRTELLLGKEALLRLSKARVAVFGLGGVGGYAAEALVRSGVGALDLFDPDRICASNLNRQILATEQSIGTYKVDAAKERFLSINPAAEIRSYPVFFLPQSAEQFDFRQYDYVIDAIDTVTGKIALVLKAQEAGVPIISSMGTGNKLDPTQLEVADLYETSVCPLARIMRKELRRRDVKSLKVVYSKEEPVRRGSEETGGNRAEVDFDGQIVRPKTQTPGTAAFVPAAAGFIIASVVVRELCADAGV